MLDQLLAYIVVIVPTIFALGIEVIDERIRKRPYWRVGVIALGLSLSGLTWWQQSRAIRTSNADRESAIRETSKQVSADVTKAVTEQYSQMISDQKTQIAQLRNQLATQGKDVSTIKENQISGRKYTAEIVAAKKSSDAYALQAKALQLSADMGPLFGYVQRAHAYIDKTNPPDHDAQLQALWGREKEIWDHDFKNRVIDIVAELRSQGLMGTEENGCFIQMTGDSLSAYQACADSIVESARQITATKLKPTKP